MGTNKKEGINQHSRSRSRYLSTNKDGIIKYESCYMHMSTKIFKDFEKKYVISVCISDNKGMKTHE